MADRSVRGQFNRVIKMKDDCVKYMMPETFSEGRYIYIKVYNIAGKYDEFVGGEYIFKLTFNNEYPVKPPVFHSLTPNGVYMIGKAPCISIGHFHPDNYVPSMGIDGFVRGIISAMIACDTLGLGVGIIDSTPDERRDYARESVEYNKKKLGSVSDMIEESYKCYSKLWRKCSNDQ